MPEKTVKQPPRATAKPAQVLSAQHTGRQFRPLKYHYFPKNTFSKIFCMEKCNSIYMNLPLL